MPIVRAIKNGPVEATPTDPAGEAPWALRTNQDHWFQVRVAVADVERAELAADLLWSFGPPAVEEATGENGLEVISGFPDESTALIAARAAEDQGLGLAVVVPVVDDGLDAWRAHARVEQAGPFLVIPAWLDDVSSGPLPGGGGADATAAASGAIPIRLDPGTTFGSGSHPTTRLVLAALAELVKPGHRVLDVGCGSGILAVAAGLLGAERVDGIDIDPQAEPVTLANAAANGVTVSVVLGTLGQARRDGALAATYDVVAANLLSPIVIDLAEDLTRVVETGGVVVVSGLLADRTSGAAEALTDAGLVAGRVTELDGWAALVFHRP